MIGLMGFIAEASVPGSVPGLAGVVKPYAPGLVGVMKPCRRPASTCKPAELV